MKIFTKVLEYFGIDNKTSMAIVELLKINGYFFYDFID